MPVPVGIREANVMSSVGQKRFKRDVGVESALPQTADIGRRGRQVRSVPQPDSCTATKQHHYSITSSAVASNVGGTVRPSILAVSALITSSNLLDCTTGRSPGLEPLRMRPM
jgi:hypothetical protein